MNLTDERRTSGVLNLAIVVTAIIGGFLIGYGIESDDDPGRAIPTRTISGVVDIVDPTGSKVCVNTGTEADPTGECSRNVSDVDVRPGDAVTGLVLTVPVQGGTQELFYLEAAE